MMTREAKLEAALRQLLGIFSGAIEGDLRLVVEDALHKPDPTDRSCTCQKCIDSCCYKPGWFLPGEAEKVAEGLGVTLQQLFRTHLAVDHWTSAAGTPDILALSPAVMPESRRYTPFPGERAIRIPGGSPGTRFAWDPTGRCVFLKDGRCTIYAVRPFECRDVMHDETRTMSSEEVALAWNTPEHQGMLRALLAGRYRG